MNVYPPQISRKSSGCALLSGEVMPEHVALQLHMALEPNTQPTCRSEFRVQSPVSKRSIISKNIPSEVFSLRNGNPLLK